jgi:uncharacterized repeat protein (TIGR01451 family)
MLTRVVVVVLSTVGFFSTAAHGQATADFRVFDDLNANGQHEGPPGGTEGPAVGQTVFVDLDASGSQNGSEPSSLTDATGRASFTGLAAGTVSVCIDPSAGWIVTTAFCQSVVLVDGQRHDGTTFGVVRAGSVGGSVRNDVGNALVGWTVTNGISTTVTDASGDYLFSGLLPATYSVSQTVQANYSQTSPAGNHSVAVAAGQAVTGIDFVNRKHTGMVNGQAFLDANADGINFQENGIADVVVGLLNSNGAEVASTTTDDTSGGYSFSGVAVGEYSLVATQAGQVKTSGNISVADGTTVQVNFGFPGIAAFELSGPNSFGAVQVGSSVAAFFAATNTGTGDLSWTGLSLDNPAFVATGVSLPVVLTAGATTAFTLTFSPTADGSQASTLTASWIDVATSSGTQTTAAISGEGLSVADLTIIKTDSVDPVQAGGNLTYTVTVSNSGPNDAVGVVVTDTLPAGLTLVSTSGCAEDPLGAPTCSLGTISNGSSRAYTITVMVDPGATGTITNSASVSSATTEANAGDESVTETTTVTAAADLVVTKTDSVDPVIAGNNLIYTVRVANSGPGDALDVVVTDVLPAGVTLDSTSGCAQDPTGTPTCSLGTITAGSSVQYRITVRVASSATGQLVNTASVSSSSTLLNTGDDSVTETTTVAAVADLVIAKSASPNPVAAGAELIYDITVTNNGPSDAQNVVTTDMLPVGVTFDSTIGCAEDPGGVPTCTLGTIPAGSSGQYKIIVRVDGNSVGTIINSARVSSSTTEGNEGDEEISVATEVEDSTPNFDMGDAPSTYPTLLVDDGARHGGDGTPALTGVGNPPPTDFESDGRPTSAADGDDADGNDDEQGVVFVAIPISDPTSTIPLLSPFYGGEILVYSSGAAHLDAWVDFNRDGDWDDGGEQVFASQPLQIGGINLTFQVPFTSSAGLSYARFRISRDGGLAPGGASPDGEVEDYLVEIGWAADFGDAPEPYPTLLADDGAAHLMFGEQTVYLGESEDPEPDGQPSVDADGDDVNIDDDEDGVTLPSVLRIGFTESIEVFLGVPSEAGLDGWIDFNRDGDWSDAGEQVFLNERIQRGALGSGQILSIQVPPDAVVGDTYARFRVSNDGGLAPTGLHDHGEVEDYKVEIGIALGSIHGTKFHDRNGDGVRTSGEEGLDGFVIALLNSVGDTLATTLTNGTAAEPGLFWFLDLLSGDYTVVELDRSGWVQTAPGNGSHSVSLASGAVVEDIDFGNAILGSVTGFKFEDVDADGAYDDSVDRAWDSEELGLPSVQFELRCVPGRGDATTARTSTTSDGSFRFERVPPGTCVAEEITVTGDFRATTETSSEPIEVRSGESWVAFAGQSSGTAGGSSLAGSLFITEVMANAVVEDTGEFVELYNSGSTPIDLTGFLIWDGDEVDQILGFLDPSNTTLAPGGYGVILDFEYAGQYDTLIPSGALLLTTDDTTVGSGLATNESVSIFEPDGTSLVDSFSWPFDPGNGVSAEKNDPTGTDSPGNWGASICSAGSSPGSANCLSGSTNSTLETEVVLTSLSFGNTRVPGGQTLGDFVWLDLNGNGVQDAGESGIGGVEVELHLAEAGAGLISSTTTDASGHYSFTGLVPGSTYQVVFGTVLDHFHTAATVCCNSEVDSDANQEGTTDPFVMGSMDDLSIDAGLVTHSVHGTLWFDANADGIRASEFSAPGIVVELLDRGNPIATRTTDAAGQYRFEGLFPASTGPEYSIRIPDRAFSLFGGDSDIINGERFSPSFYFVAGDSGSNPFIGAADVTIDAGLVSHTVDGVVWEDSDGNGVRENEPGLAGISVELYQDGLGLISTEITGANGEYSFGGLQPFWFGAKYTLAIPLFDRTTLFRAGGNGDIDSDFLQGSIGVSPQFRFALGSSPNPDVGNPDLTLDAGLLPFPTLLGTAWYDADRDGLRDTDEPGVEGVSVAINPASFSASATTTDANGEYSLVDLIGVSTSYEVTFTSPDGFPYTAFQSCCEPSLDSDADTQTGTTPVFDFPPGVTSLTRDVGFLLTHVGGMAWRDLNGDGIRQPSEPAMAGINVSIDEQEADLSSVKTRAGLSTDLPMTTVTAPDGTYSFMLAEGIDYSIEVEIPDGFGITLSNQGPDQALDSDFQIDPTVSANAVGNPTTLPSYGATGTIETGYQDLTIDAGLVSLTDITFTAWLDVDGDGERDGPAADLDLQFRPVGRNPNRESTNCRTDAEGACTVPYIAPGAWILEENGDEAGALVAAGTGSILDPVIINPDGQVGLEFNMIPGGTVGNLVWFDADQDGLQDPGESGVPGVTVNLLHESTYSDASLKFSSTHLQSFLSTTTDANGEFEISHIPPGFPYALEFVPAIEGNTFTAALIGTNPAIDSDANPDTTASFPIAAGQLNHALDAGLLLTQVGGRVWNDLDENGLQDAGEVGIDGLTVTYTIGALFAASVETAGGGLYNVVLPIETPDWSARASDKRLDLVTEYEVVLEFSRPPEFSFSPDHAGADQTIDSNADEVTGSASVTIATGNQDLTIDAGMFFDSGTLANVVVFNGAEGLGSLDVVIEGTRVKDLSYGETTDLLPSSLGLINVRTLSEGSLTHESVLTLSSDGGTQKFLILLSNGSEQELETTVLEFAAEGTTVVNARTETVKTLARAGPPHPDGTASTIVEVEYADRMVNVRGDWLQTSAIDGPVSELGHLARQSFDVGAEAAWTTPFRLGQYVFPARNLGQSIVILTQTGPVAVFADGSTAVQGQHTAGIQVINAVGDDAIGAMGMVGNGASINELGNHSATATLAAVPGVFQATVAGRDYNGLGQLEEASLSLVLLVPAGNSEANPVGPSFVLRDGPPLVGYAAIGDDMLVGSESTCQAMREGKILVRYPWLSGDETESFWARISDLLPGQEFGTFALPHVEDEVIQRFEFGTDLRPGEFVTWFSACDGQVPTMRYHTSLGETVGPISETPYFRNTVRKNLDLNSNGAVDTGELPGENFMFEFVADGLSGVLSTDAAGLAHVISTGGFASMTEIVPAGTELTSVQIDGLLAIREVASENGFTALGRERVFLAHNFEAGIVTPIDAGSAAAGDDIISGLTGCGAVCTLEFTGNAGKSASVITLTSPLPPVDVPVKIIGDGTVILDGSLLPAGTPGLVLRGSTSLVTGMELSGFPGDAIVIEGDAVERVIIDGNSIHDNAGSGIVVRDGRYHALRRNAIYGNGGLPIDLGGDDETANDIGDLDNGPNGLLNTPSLSEALTGSTVIAGTIDGLPGVSVTLDFYSAIMCGPDGTADPEAFLGTATAGDLFRVSIPGRVDIGSGIVAVAVDDRGNTSEVSNCVTVGFGAALVQIVLTPESITLTPFESHQFNAQGLDQLGMAFAFVPAWSATGGSVDSTGFFTSVGQVGSFQVTASDAGISGVANVEVVSGVPVEETSDLPAEYALYRNYPNPFNPVTRLRFDLPAPDRVRIEVFDVLGRRQAVVLNRDLPAGRHEISWDATTFPSGLYFYRLQAGTFSQTKQMILLR